MESVRTSNEALASSKAPLRAGHAAPAAPASFAFLVHSQDTIPRNLPPAVDNKSLARQRRRRTSPEDQAILEAEFHHDSKPDKDARRRIVERVALGEKEVQIWFQNRRQNKRRKSQPPLSYEILPRLEPSSETSHLQHDDGAASSPSQGPPSGDEGNTALAINASALEGSSQTATSQEAVIRNDVDTGAETIPQLLPASSALSIDTSPSQDAVPTAQDATPPTTVANATTTPPQERDSSRVRLSMTSNGGARIISGMETTPSPPRSQPLAPTPFATRQTLRRSYSAAGLQQFDGCGKSNGSQRSGGGRSSVGSFTTRNLLGRQPSGRSRDSRAWEFWCDSDARNGLARQAEAETTGSAADAISLIRSNSGAQRRRLLHKHGSASAAALMPNFNKANLALLEREGSGSGAIKRLKRDGDHLVYDNEWRVDDFGDGTELKIKGKRGRGKKLERAMSSAAKLQDRTTTLTMTKRGDNPISPTSKGDSDKENVEPGDAGIARLIGNRNSGDSDDRDPTKRKVLGESRTVPALNDTKRSSQGALGICGTRCREGVPERRTGKLPPSSLSWPADADANVVAAARYTGAARRGPFSTSSEEDPEDDGEVVRFMRMAQQGIWSGTEGSVDEDGENNDEMDCAAGLLSLSQGNWR